MNHIVAITNIIQLVLLLVVILYTASKKEETINKGVISVVSLVIIIMLLLSATNSEDYGIAKTDLPREDLPLFVKAIRVEGESNVYMEIVPYNDINASKQPFYKISAEKFQQLENITAGTVIINDNGVIKPFSITLKV